MKNILKIFIFLNLFLNSSITVFAADEVNISAALQNSNQAIENPENTSILNKIKNNKGKVIAALGLISTLGAFLRAYSVSNQLDNVYKTSFEEVRHSLNEEDPEKLKAKKLEVFNDFSKKPYVQKANSCSDKLKKCPIKIFNAKNDSCPTCPSCKNSFDGLSIKFKDNSSPFCFMPCCKYQFCICLDCFVKSYNNKNPSDCKCLNCNTSLSSNSSELNELYLLFNNSSIPGQTRQEAIKNFIKDNRKKWDSKKTYRNIVDQVSNEICQRDMAVENLDKKINKLNPEAIKVQAKLNATSQAEAFRKNLNSLDKALLSCYEKLEQHKKEIAIGAGATAVVVSIGGLIYYLYKKGYFKKKPKLVDEFDSNLDLEDTNLEPNDELTPSGNPSDKLEEDLDDYDDLLDDDNDFDI